MVNIGFPVRSTTARLVRMAVPVRSIAAIAGAGFYSFHPGGCHFVMGDGSVKYLMEHVKAHTLASMITRENAKYYEETE